MNGPGPSLAKRGVKRWMSKLCFVVVPVAWPSAWAQEIEWPAVPERTVWLAAAHESFGDGQAASTPVDTSTAAKLGQALERLAGEQGHYGDGLVLRFLPGDYETHGIRVRPRWHIVGAGIGRTTLKLMPGVEHRKIKSAYHSVIGGGWGPQRLAKRDFDNIRIADVSLDCNWDGMKKALGPILKKTSGVDLLARQALVERVQVSRFGAVGGRPSWREVFPIRVISGMGDGANLPGYRDSIIEIRHCLVEDFVRGPGTGTAWPYCTGIMVSHRGADPVNGTVRAWVHHNEIRNVVNGIAFGGAFLRRAEFYGNTVTNCGIGFNFDTGGNRGVVIRDNRFFACIGGGSVNDGTAFVIRDNTFRLIAPHAPRFAYWHNGLRLWDHTRGFLVEGNRVMVDGESMTTARGILLHGTSVGLRLFQNETGEWQREIDPHRFRDNHYGGLRPNLAGPQQAGNDMHLLVGDHAVHLTGEADAVQFTWPDD
ncbi:MAG: right-handed parallel beta-helix repeat-containing protein [Verrucomicrobiota bacterium]|nr:right-handed parallel beta-helix repeat-containing protein [Verrucomicrobiota bacterium]